MRDTPGRRADRLELDHQDLFRQLSELRAALRAGIRSEVTETLAFVRRYADRHFALEEREMIATAYPMLAVHRAAHGRISREIRALEEEWSRNGVTPVLADSVLEALSDWFEVHILELDAQLIRHLRAAAPAPEPARGRPARAGRLSRSARG